MNRFVLFCSGLLLMCSIPGCCLLGGGCGGGGCGGGYGAAYPYGGGGGCANGACGASAQSYPSAFNPAYQQAYSPGTTTAFVDPVPTF